MLLFCTLNPCIQTVTASNNTSFSTHSINAIKSAYANLAMAMSHCWIASKQLGPNSYNLYILKPLTMLKSK
jgi:hypothetical protein